MPQINLLSPTSRKKVTKIIIPGDPKSEFSRVLPSVLKRSAICVAVGVIAWIILAVNTVSREKVYHELDAKVKALGADPKEMETLRTERAALEKKVALIDELSSRKFFWYQKFELLASILPEGIWFEEISFKPGKSSPGKKPATTVETSELFIRGTAVAYSLDDAISLIGGFVDRLGKHPEFANDFSDVDFNTSKGSIGGLDVMKFDFSGKSK